MIAERLEKDLEEFHEMIVDRCNGRLDRCSPEHWNYKYGYSRPAFEDVENDPSKLTLPYDNTDSSLRKIRNAGRWLSTQPTVIGIREKFVSYVVGRGHEYDIKPRREFIGDELRPNSAKIRQAERLTIELEFILDEELGWYDIQKETVERLFEDGEAFRRLWNVDGEWDITFMEPESIRNPTEVRQITNREELPTPVVALISGDTPNWGVHGISFNPMDVREIYGYWHHVGNDPTDGEQFEFVENTDMVQHVKNGVKRNDPRGIPMVYWAIPQATSINEVDGSMVDLSLVQAKYAVVHNYKNSALSGQLENIAKNRQDDSAMNAGRPLPPGETDAKGTDIQINQMANSARDSIEIIQQMQRYIGNMVDMPEFMVTADANTGGRSNLISAEGPFDRRTQREQIRLFKFDKQLFSVILAGDPDYTTRDFKTIPEFPVAATRDKAKEIESEVLLVESELQSEDMARDNLKIDSTRAKIEISQQDRPSQREQMNAGKNNQGESRRTAGNPGSGMSARPTQGRQGARADT